MVMTKRRKTFIFSGIGILIVLLGIFISLLCVYRFVGFPECVGEKTYDYETREIHVLHDDVNLYGIAYVPKDDSRSSFPTVIYSHGAGEDHDEDKTTLKSLAMSGVASYAFDYYGWSKRSTGNKGAGYFSSTPMSEKEKYKEQVKSQVIDLSNVIEKVSDFDFVDKTHLYLLGSSMGGVTAAVTAPRYTDLLRGLILEYPAMFLSDEAMVKGSQYDVSGYKGNVLIQHGKEDSMVSIEYSRKLCDYYNETYTHATLKEYEHEGHGFSGKYKVVSARAIYEFMKVN